MSEFSIICTDFEEGGEIPKNCGYKHGNEKPELDFVPSGISLTESSGFLFPFLYPHFRGISPPSEKSELVSLKYPSLRLNTICLILYSSTVKFC